MDLKLERKPNVKNDYSHLTPIVDFLISEGCEQKNEYLWGVNRTGYFCHLKGDVDINTLRDELDLPDSIVINEELKQIDCSISYCVIRFGL